MAVLATTIGALLGTTALAQDTRDAEEATAQQRRFLEREARQRQQLAPPADVRLQLVAQASAPRLPADETPCHIIRQVQLAGPDAPAFAWLTQALAGSQADDSPVNRCLGATGIGVLIDRLNSALVERGYVTSRVLAPSQDLSAGELQLAVLAGRVHAIRFAEPASPRANAWNAMPMGPADIFNLRDVEQALENLKRVPTAEADIQIVPAEHPGESDLLIQWTQGTPLRLNLSLDDSGSHATGRYQASTSLSYDHWWTLNDLFYITLGHDAGGGDPGQRGTRNTSVHYSVPWGYWTLSLNASRQRYHQSVAGLSQNYIYSGRSAQQDLGLSRLVLRGKSYKTTLTLKAFARQSSNFIDDTEVEVQRRQTGGWELQAQHKAYLSQGTLDLQASYKRGTGAFGATRAPEEAFGEGTSRFALVTADVSLSWPFQWGGVPLQFNSHVHAQHNRTPLTPQDRMAIGSRYSVRGFDGESSLSAERGWWWRNDLAVPLGQSDQQLYLGLDRGCVGGPSTSLLVGRCLGGAALGLRGTWRLFSYDLFVGWLLSKPQGFQTANATAGFQMSVSF